MPTFVNSMGKLVVIDDLPGNAPLIEILKKGGLVELRDTAFVSQHDSQDIIDQKLTILPKTFVAFPAFDALEEKFPDAADEEEIFECAKTLQGYEEFTLQDAKSFLAYRKEKQRAIQDGNYHHSNGRSQ